MTLRNKKDIAKFQKLYLRHYGKNLTLEEAEKRLDALVQLIRIIQDVPTQKQTSEIKLKLKIKNKPSSQ